MSGKETVKSGYLTKSPPDSKNAFYAWKKRYFILIDSQRAFPFAPRNIRLEYYNNFQDSKLGNPLGMIELNKCSGVLKREQMKSHKHVFDIVTPTRVFHLSADSMEEREEWVELLNTNIFLFNQVPPAKNNIHKYDPNRRSSDFSLESDSLVVSLNRSVKSEPRTQSLRVPKSVSVLPSSPPPVFDMFFPISPEHSIGPDSYPNNLKIISSAKDSDQIYANSYSDNDIVSEKGFTAVPLPVQGANRPNSMISSLPVNIESQYINVSYTSGAKSTSCSPTHPMLPAPYKKFPISNSTQGIASQKLSDEIESEYTCIDPLKMAPILEEYAQVKKHK